MHGSDAPHDSHYQDATMQQATQHIDRRTTVDRTVRARRRMQQALTLVAAALALVLSACGSSDRVTSPASALAVATTPRSQVDAFNAVQGTYCNDAAGIPCFADPELGYITLACSRDCARSITVDFGAVIRRWWDRHSVREYPALRSSGTISETRQHDGRRRLMVNIRTTNTFVAVWDADFNPIVGVEFFEIYPTPDAVSATPVAGDVTLHAEMVLPVGYLGYPDIVEAVFDPTSGIEVRTFSTTVSVDGPLRRAYDGIPAGTMVRVHAVSRWLPKLGARAVPSRHLMELGYDPTSRIEVRVLR